MTEKEVRAILDADLSELTPHERALALAHKIKLCKSNAGKRALKSAETDRQRAVRLTREVSFLETKEEKNMYFSALMEAMSWGRKIESEGKASQRSVIEQAGGKLEQKQETSEERSARIKLAFERQIILQEKHSSNK